MSRNWKHAIGAIVILSLAAGQTAAQQAGQTQRNQGQQSGQQQGQQSQQQFQQRSGSGQAGQLDKHLAKLLIAKNEAAIKVNELGQQQAQDQQVQQYASQMVQAHQQLNQKLQQVAGTSSQSGQQQGSQQQGQQSSQQRSQPGQSGQSGSQQGGAAEKMVQMFERVESQFADKLTQGLRDKQGQQFDNTLMGLEVLAHMRMVETLDVMQQQASGELQQILQQAHKETQKHLQEAEQLSQKLEKTAVAQRPQSDQQQPQQ